MKNYKLLGWLLILIGLIIFLFGGGSYSLPAADIFGMSEDATITIPLHQFVGFITFVIGLIIIKKG